MNSKNNINKIIIVTLLLTVMLSSLIIVHAKEDFIYVGTINGNDQFLEYDSVSSFRDQNTPTTISARVWMNAPKEEKANMPNAENFVQRLDFRNIDGRIYYTISHIWILDEKRNVIKEWKPNYEYTEAEPGSVARKIAQMAVDILTQKNK